MTGKNLVLSDCALEFGALLSKCELTDRNGASLELESGMTVAMQTLASVRSKKGNVFVIGNGGSAGVASHAVVDLVNVAKMRAYTLHEPALMTCKTNDFGYEYAFASMVEDMASPEDALIAISSSGKSMNIRNAVEQFIKLGGVTVTLSGFSANNPLRALGDINIWLDSSDYGMVEIGHQFILHNLSDRFGVLQKNGG